MNSFKECRSEILYMDETARRRPNRIFYRLLRIHSYLLSKMHQCLFNTGSTAGSRLCLATGTWRVSTEFIKFHWIYRCISENENSDQRLQMNSNLHNSYVADTISLLHTLPGFMEQPGQNPCCFPNHLTALSETNTTNEGRGKEHIWSPKRYHSFNSAQHCPESFNRLYSARFLHQ